MAALASSMSLARSFFLNAVAIFQIYQNGSEQLCIAAVSRCLSGLGTHGLRRDFKIPT